MLNTEQLRRLARIDREELELTTERFNLGVAHMSSEQQTRWFELADQLEALSTERKKIVAIGRAKPMPILVQETVTTNIHAIP